jgi:beta-glucosidase/6-phospho-beta-glucosidase/beta-galactosidase
MLHSCAAAVLLSACGGDESTTGGAGEALPFPEGFQLGAAIAGFQVEMGCPTLDAAECEDPGSDWYQFITSPETLGDSKAHLAGDPPSAGPGHYELYERDFDLAKSELGSTSLRLSLEWSRIFPTATDEVEGYPALKALADPAALEHYHAVFAALKARGLRPLVTLNHYTLPTWIHDAVGCHADLDTCSPRGWVDKDRTVREIAKYAGFCAREFGAEVDQWATLNEPFAVVLPGYLMPSPDRTNPPAASLRFAEAKTVLVGLIEAHARMYDAVKVNDEDDVDGDGEASQVGVVYAMAPVRPKDPENELDVAAAKNVFYLWNMVYLNGVAKGELDADLDGEAEHRDDLANRMDYIGINYYTRITVVGTTSPYLPELSPLSTFDPFRLEPWEDYPKGLYEMAMVVRDDLELPAIVTENGAEDPSDDGTGPSYMVRHLTWLSRAIAEGADVRGYFYWTLMDNYEWNHGMDIRMGLYAVDEADPTKARVARKAAGVFAQVAAAGGVPADLASRYPAPRD